LIGYSDAPTFLQLVAYVGTLVVIFVLMRVISPKPVPRSRAAAGVS